MSKKSKTAELFHKIAAVTSRTIGSPPAFILAILMILVWLISGPFFHYSDTWELIINTTTTIITFVVVFLIQATQNRDSHALHIKLDELIRAHKSAHNQFIGLEKLTDSQLEDLQTQITNQEIAKQSRKKKIEHNE